MKRTILKHLLGVAAVLVLLFSGLTAYGQDIVVQGKITISGSSEGAPGVTVSIQGTTRGTVTDNQGNYRLTGVLPSDTLVFSYIGFKKENRAVNGQTRINVSMERESSSLDQVVVIGYGTQKKKDLTGAISSISAAQLKNENPISIQDMLRSNISGLNVGFSTGAKPGGDMQIRGKNTLNAGSDPLIVLDGVIYNGSLSDINPADIASIDVLKDASSVAVYGAKAAEGVIAITTKKGKTGKPVINFNANISLATMEVNQRPYSASEFIKFREDVQYSRNAASAKPYQYSDPSKLPSNISVADWLAYDGSAGDPEKVWLTRLNMYPIEITDYLAGKSVNWYDVVFQNGLQQNYTLSLSGKTKGISYYWSGGYENNEGIVVGDKYSTVRSRLNLEAQVTNFLTVGVSTQFADRDESSVPMDWNKGITNSPWGDMYNDDSTDYRFSPNDQNGIGQAQSPFGEPEYTDRRKKYYTLNSNIYGKVNLPFGITYKINFTPDIEWYQYDNHQSSKFLGSGWDKQGGLAQREEHMQYHWEIDNLLSWKRTFGGDHHLEVTLLQNAEKYQYWENRMENSGFDPNDDLGYHNIGAGIKPIITNDDQYGTGAALMGRLFYSYKERYLLTLSVRRDGYSAFGQSNPWATFPAAAFGWVFSQEPFFKSSWLDFGKLRLSYGVNGNRDIGRYVALANLTSGKYFHVTSGGTVESVSQLYVNNMPNPNLQWEQTASYNIGLDFSMFRDKVGGSINVYKSKTTNLLVKRSLPPIIGFDYIWTNLGEVDNKGLELNVHSHNIHQPDFSWNTSANFSLNRNEVVHLYGDMTDITDANGKVIGQKESDDITNKWFIGHALDAVWNTKVLGVYQTSQKDLANKYGQQPGDFRLQDVNGDGKYTNEDRQFLGFTEPRFRWTLRNEFTFYQNITLSFLIYSYWGQMGSFNDAKNNAGFIDRTSYYKLPHWTKDNPQTEYARLYSSDGSASYSVYRKKSFIRLENVAVAYTFPKTMLKRASIEDLRLYFTVKNAAFYAPDWNFWDPENSGPTPRTFTLGINLTL
ncbi:MAG TPA: TonB-dependent receptor [Chitinophagaceae bacterium]|nr:TonB-dependent receptor [Chitinophagaceae bacterium]